jgi:5'-3' exonuclease
MNIVIDGNAFLNVSASIVKNMLQKDKRIGEKYFVNDLLDDSKFMLKQQAAATFRNFVINYFSSIVSPFKGSTGAVFFVFDSKSWRKEYINQFFKEDDKQEGQFEYKGNRKYDDKIYLFFELFQNEILSDLREMGAVSSRILGAEGDDLIAHIVDNFQGDLCIWSVDKDLIQLLESGNRSVILVTPKMMTKNKRVFVAHKKQEDRPIDIFNFESAVDNSNLDEILREFTQRDFVKYEVDPAEELMLKILGGDASDAIPRVHPKMTKSKIEAVIAKLKSNEGDWSVLVHKLRTNDPYVKDMIVEASVKELKLTTQDSQDQFRKTLGFNIKIICLSIDHVPAKLSGSIQESFDFNSVKRFDINAFKKYHSSK